MVTVMLEKLIADMGYPELIAKSILQLLVIWFTWSVLRDLGVYFLKKTYNPDLGAVYFYCQMCVAAIIVGNTYLAIVFWVGGLLFQLN